jgi:hypothetical protein
MFFVEGLFFCWKCGAYSRKAVRLLLGKCKANPPKGSHGRRTLAAIAAGRCPVTGRLFGERPFPVAGLVVDLLLPGVRAMATGRPRLRRKS